MKTLGRYIAREVLTYTALMLFALLSLWLIIDILQDASNVGSTRTAAQSALLALASVPAIVYEILPFAVLLGGLFALTQLNVNSEYTVMRASGVSVGRIAWVLALIGLALALFAFFIAEVVVPRTERVTQRLRAQVGTQSTVAQRFQSGFWFKEDKRFINIREVVANSTLSDVRVYEFDDSNRLQTITRAQSAEHIAGKQWQLKGVSVTRFDDSRVGASKVNVQEWQSALSPNLLTALQVQPDRLSASNLFEYIQHLSRNQQRSPRFEAALWGKFLYPLACVMLLLLALPFAQVSKRSGAVAMRVFMGVLIGLGFVLLNRLCSYLGQLYGWPPALGALLPYGVFGAITLGLIWQVERR